jgi:hypothetical protein
LRKIGIAYDNWNPILHNPMIVVKRIEPLVSSNGRSCSPESRKQTNNSAFTGLLCKSLRVDIREDKGNAPSLASAYVILPVTATELRPAKNKFEVTSQASTQPILSPDASINRLTAPTPVPGPVASSSTTFGISVKENNIPNSKIRPDIPVAKTVSTTPLAAAVVL